MTSQGKTWNIILVLALVLALIVPPIGADTACTFANLTVDSLTSTYNQTYEGYNASILARGYATYDATVFQNASHTIAVARNGTVLSAVLISAHTDDVPIQAAIDSLPNGGKIDVMNGVYTLTTGLSITSGIHIEGASYTRDITKGTVFKQGANVTLLANSLPADDWSSQTSITIKNINLDGDAKTHAGNGILMHGVQFLNLENINIINFDGLGLIVDYCLYSKINNVVTGGHTGKSYRSGSVAANYIRSGQDSVFNHLTGGGGDTVPTAGYGILIENTWDSEFNHIQYNSAQYGGIVISSSSDNTFIDVTANDNRREGLVLSSSNGNRLLSGRIFNNSIETTNSYAGIEVINSEDNLIMGYTIYNPSSIVQVYGIGISGTSKNNTIFANDVVGNTYPIIEYGGSATGSNNIHDNTGYLTRSKGVSTVADGGTIAHNLSVTPPWCVGHPSVRGDEVSTASIGATTCTFNVTNSSTGLPGTTQTIYWVAEA